MVVAQEPIAADVGLKILESGGNAIDAAVAVGFTLAVTYPYAGNIGGGGFMLIRLTNGATAFIDFREIAPSQASSNMFPPVANGKLQDSSTSRWCSAGVPGTVRGLYMAFTNYGSGSKQWSELIKPAIDLANDGFPISYWQSENFKTSAVLKNDANSSNLFLNNGKGACFGFGETLRQTNLARTLTRIANNPDDFYTGETARMIASAMKANGGLMTLADLHDYEAIPREPLKGRYRGYDIITAPPPSSGGVGILQMLGMLDGTGYTNHGAGSAESCHYLAEVMRRAFADGTEVGDPAFVKNHTQAMLDPSYLKQCRDSIRRTSATRTRDVKPGTNEWINTDTGADTTHFSIVDSEGNAVAVTYSLNSGYGSGITVPGAGFLLNDTMMDFLIGPPYSPDQFGKIQGPKNAIEANKRPLSSMSPTIVLRDNKPFLVLGAPGGARIITAVLQVMLNVIDFGMNVQDAVDFPRIHHPWTRDPKEDYLEFECGVSPDTLAQLMKMGYKIHLGKPKVLARVEAILIDTNGTTTHVWLQGAHDPRGIGKAVGD